MVRDECTVVFVTVLCSEHFVLFLESVQTVSCVLVTVSLGKFHQKKGKAPPPVAWVVDDPMDDRGCGRGSQLDLVT